VVKRLGAQPGFVQSSTCGEEFACPQDNPSSLHAGPRTDELFARDAVGRRALLNGAPRTAAAIRRRISKADLFGHPVRDLARAIDAAGARAPSLRQAVFVSRTATSSEICGLPRVRARLVFSYARRGRPLADEFQIDAVALICGSRGRPPSTLCAGGVDVLVNNAP